MVKPDLFVPCRKSSKSSRKKGLHAGELLRPCLKPDEILKKIQ